ncbi:alpha/beta fold hydrolase [Parvibaculum sp.]|uniref:alpha/beta hydrolase n=1 Tax=Parvibaculum sp. TaxID=2024848 RepID=UPI00329847F4
MTRLVLALMLLVASAVTANAASWNEREVSLEGGLSGTLVMPQGEGPVDAALILAGSGPTDRDGNFPSGQNNSLKLLAHALGERGIASLRIDKRGVGGSIGAARAEEELRAETYVEDAIRWLELLEREPRIRRVVALGHSEGALLATLAARRHEVSGLVLLTPSGRPAPALIREQLAGQSLPPEITLRSEEILQSLERGETVADVPPQLDMLYRPSVQPYLISWFKYDPAAELARTDVPVLVVQGTRDLQQRPADGEKLAAAREGVTLIAIENMNHVLKVAPEDRAGNMALYVDPHAELAPGLAGAIAGFIGKMTEAPKP